MKTILKILSLLVFISGCKSEEIITPEDIYVEYIVAQAEIRANEIFPNVRFTKTLPLDVSYDIKKAELTDVTAYIVKNEIQVIPLIYTTNGLYKPKYEVNVQEGETYELYADYHGKFIYSKTLVPYAPNVTRTHYNSNNFTLNADIVTKADEVYGALWVISGLPPDSAKDFYSITKSTYQSGTQISIGTAPLPEKYHGQLYSERRFIKIFAFDKSFRDYFYSRNSGQEVNDPFIQGGGLVDWNVQGDKVIGMFIGLNSGIVMQVN